MSFVWDTDLRFYASRLHDITKEEAVETWRRKAENGEGVMLNFRGVLAFGHEKTANSPAALSFIERDLGLQFVSDTHTLEELSQLADAITYEAR